ncbi:MAG: hypothetical protein AAGJ28_04060 [Pseudomonadota bacterium]
MKLPSLLGLLLCGIANISVAFALDLEGAKSLSLSKNITELEAAFDAHSAGYANGSINADDYAAPFRAFETTHPDVQNAVKEWREASSDSENALAAEGILITHRADLIRGEARPRDLPAAAKTKIATLADVAAPMLEKTLTRQPNHVAAARALNRLGAIAERPELRVKALDHLRRFDDPDRTLLSELLFADLSWRGSPGSPMQLCSIRTKSAPRISLQQCIVYAQAQLRDRTPAFAEEWRTELSKGPEDLFPEAHFHAKLIESPAAAHKFAIERGGISPMTGLTLAYMFDAETVLEDFVRPALDYDPDNPNWLSVLYGIQFRTGDINGAWHTINRAMHLGEHHPTLRHVKIAIHEENEVLKWQIVDELRDAFAATGGDMNFVGRQIDRLLEPQKHLTHLQDGTPNDDFPCVQLLFLERHKAWCKVVGTDLEQGGDYTCDRGHAIERDKIINRNRIRAGCGQAVTWKDRLRYFLDLTE